VSIAPTDLSQPVIISAALTGSWPTKAQNPALPVTEEEIAEAAIAAHAAGAAIVHLHVRNDQGNVTCEPARYARARELIRAAGSDVIINMSTGGGAGQTTDAERIEPVRLRPEIASFDCGSLNFGKTVFINSPPFLEELAALMNEHGVLPEVE
jgi:3-keto-5-aminohexanoate cleavage enzyme